MKTLLISFYCSFFFFVNDSTTDNFTLNDGAIIWQKVFTTELSKEQLIKEIRTSGEFKNVSLHGESLTAEISELYLDFNGYGDKSKLPRLSARSINSYVIIDFKKNKYRVTIKAIKLAPIVTGGESYSRTIDLEEFAINKEDNGFKDKFLNKASKVMDFTFQKISDFKKTEEKNNW